jgi:hypothetical protein
MQSRGINLGSTGRRRGRGCRCGPGPRRRRGRKVEAAAPKLVYVMPYKILYNLLVSQGDIT